MRLLVLTDHAHRPLKLARSTIYLFTYLTVDTVPQFVSCSTRLQQLHTGDGAIAAIGCAGLPVPASIPRADPYPRVRVGPDTGIPSFTPKEHNFSRFWSENLFISACFLNYL